MSLGVARLSWLEHIWLKIPGRKRELVRLAALNISQHDQTYRLAEVLVYELRRIDWTVPAAILEKMITREAAREHESRKPRAAETLC
jgi:hypothetical protein